MIEIRDATLEDVEFIADANARLAWETEAKELDFETLTHGVSSALRDSGKARYWIAEADGEPVGQLMVTLEWSDWRNGDFWWIQSVYVHQSHRRQGVFKALYQRVARLAEEAECVCGLRLYVEHENTAAQQTYRRLGMAPTPYQIFEKDWS